MTELNKIKNKSTYFTDIRQVNGTGYTMGGKVASQAGIPLFTPFHGNAFSGSDSYLPSVKTIGDLLKEKNYYLTFYGGADLDFAGKGKFYKTHNFDEVYGVNELSEKIQNDKLNLNNWGLYDKDLLDLSYEKFLKLSKNKEKFALFLLTIGTHQPKGHSSIDIEYKDGNNKMLNSVAATDFLVAQFINKILATSYKDDVIIVIASDHLAMKNEAYNLLNKGERRNTFMIIDPAKLKKNEIEKTGSTLDIGPTILPFMGFKGEIGLGRDLLSGNYNKSEILKIHSSIIDWKNVILDFWD